MNIIPQVYAESLGAITGTGQFQNIGAGPETLLGKFLSTMITTMTIFGSLAFVVYFSLGALTWITAGGDKTKIGSAQSQMTQGAIGLIAIVASYFIIGIVGNVLGLNILNPIKMLNTIN
jgi:hypothetical protein